jgi:hypothetical protein
MKRIVAIAALAVAMASIPATAMASTGGPAPGPGPVPARCPAGVSVPPPGRALVPVAKPAPGKPVVVAVVCCGQVQVRRNTTRPVPVGRFCRVQTVVFDMAAGSSVVTEVHGVRVHHGERLLFQGQLYTVSSVWGNHFDVDHQGRLVVNTGPAIRNGLAIVLGGRGTYVVISRAPVPAPPPGH